MENMERTYKILIVDDEKDIRKLVGIYLKKQGYEVIEAENGYASIEAVRENNDIDLIIMDIMMPGMSGIEACKTIREFSSVPVLFLTAKTQEPDKNEAYDVGGDDFISKPFVPNELVRKVKALIRRYNVYKGRESEDNSVIRVANIIIEPYKRLVTKNDEVVHLTDKEFALLLFLVENRGRAWSLVQLYENIWQEQYLQSSSNTVMVHILRLRQKIEDNPAQPEIIRTIYGKGYQVD
jgi:DNA-binding response OmpR family regulator